MLFRGTVFFAAFVAGYPLSAGEALLPTEQAECLRDNADAYLEFVDGPTLVFPGFCADGEFNPTPKQIAEATSQNSGAAGSIVRFDAETLERYPELTSLPANEKALMLVMTARQFRCLQDQFESIKDEGKPIGVTRLDFDACPD